MAESSSFFKFLNPAAKSENIDESAPTLKKALAVNLAAKPALRALLSFLDCTPVPTQQVFPRISRLYDSPGLGGKISKPPPESPEWLQRFFLADVFDREDDGRPHNHIQAEDLVIGDVLVVKPQSLLIHKIVGVDAKQDILAQHSDFLSRVSLLAVEDPDQNFSYFRPYRRFKTRSSEWALGKVESVGSVFQSGKHSLISEGTGLKISCHWKWPVPFFITREKLDERSQELHQNQLVRDFQVNPERALLMPLVIELTVFTRSHQRQFPALVGSCLSESFRMLDLRSQQKQFCLPVVRKGEKAGYLKFSMFLSVYPGIGKIVREMKQVKNLDEIDDDWLFQRLLPFQCAEGDGDMPRLANAISHSITPPRFPPKLDVQLSENETTKKFNALWESHGIELSPTRDKTPTPEPETVPVPPPDLEISPALVSDIVQRHRRSSGGHTPSVTTSLKIENTRKYFFGWSQGESRGEANDSAPKLDNPPEKAGTGTSAEQVGSPTPISSTPTRRESLGQSSLKSVPKKDVALRSNEERSRLHTLPSFGPYAPSGFLPDTSVPLFDKVATMIQTDISNVVSPPRPRLRLPPAFDHFYKVARNPVQAPVSARSTQTTAIVPQQFLTPIGRPETVAKKSDSVNLQICPVQAFAGLGIGTQKAGPAIYPVDAAFKFISEHAI